MALVLLFFVFINNYYFLIKCVNMFVFQRRCKLDRMALSLSLIFDSSVEILLGFDELRRILIHN